METEKKKRHYVSEETKLEIGRLYVQGEQTCAQLMETYHLSVPGLVYKYSKIWKNRTNPSTSSITTIPNDSMIMEMRQKIMELEEINLSLQLELDTMRKLLLLAGKHL